MKAKFTFYSMDEPQFQITNNGKFKTWSKKGDRKLTKYKDWTNYATWRVNLEIFDGIEAADKGWNRLDLYNLAQAMKDYATEVIECDMPEGLALDYARDFVSEVNWREIAEYYVAQQSTTSKRVQNGTI